MRRDGHGVCEFHVCRTRHPYNSAAASELRVHTKCGRGRLRQQQNKTIHKYINAYAAR